LKHASFWKTPLAYFILTILLSWSCLFAAVFSGQPMGSQPTTILFYLGAGGPFLVSSGLVLLAHEKDYRRDFLRRIVDGKRIQGAWWALVLLFFPALNLISIGLAALTGLAKADFNITRALLADPLGLIWMAVFLFFFGPLPEELGWRGYAQERLNLRVSPLTASLIIGMVWAVWHIPMYLIPGTYQNQWGFLSDVFWIRSASIILEAVIIGWVFTRTHNSTLSAILIHFVVNFSGELLELSIPAEFIRMGLVAGTVLLIGLFWKEGRQRTVLPE